MAGPYPLATLGCTLNATGISAPQYSDILASLQASAQQIFGSDVYLAPDSQDGQLLAVFAKAINDCNNATIADYNARSVASAQGAALASLVKNNGITVQAATNSTCPVVITGVVGTTINNGIVQDTAGNLWSLPGQFTIPVSGSITVTATAQNAGNILSPIGTLTGIYTPIAGWQSVSNTVSGSPGIPVPSDAAVRAEQADAVALPSQSINGGILGAVESLPGVGLATLYDNDTASPDANGVPAHSIAVVVEGGSVQAIINAIGARKTPGTGTQGSITGTYIDPVAGLSNPIKYFPLTQVPIQINITLTPLTGYVGSTATLIANTLVQYIGTMNIGQTVMYTKLFSPANLSGSAALAATGLTQAQLDVLSATYDITAITVGLAPGTPASADLPIGYTSIAQLSGSNVTVTV